MTFHLVPPGHRPIKLMTIPLASAVLSISSKHPCVEQDRMGLSHRQAEEAGEQLESLCLFIGFVDSKKSTEYRQPFTLKMLPMVNANKYR